MIRKYLYEHVSHPGGLGGGGDEVTSNNYDGVCLQDSKTRYPKM